ncbi:MULTISPECIES: alpha/beta hydrolase [unclassified Fusibacter]|uniref:alpha/beta hydrolase n=1 Tax=unclassified Fusibacter TaxID=2624464 RepID=UPI0010118B7E|nr:MULTISPECIES: alpha/beta hydrolase [unclassified Fusibacter]MCK8058569.1 alpha/beta hydrolase [Fusibacter sp. A2]NPE22661.1 alpha/beta hydrolase [Fusibacter sp. A1]RXV60224.1 alpha/beta hydrolase [Fusibacter sp. A1]
MLNEKYAIHPELKDQSSYQLSEFYMTRLGSNIYNLYAVLNCLFVKKPAEIRSKKYWFKGYKKYAISASVYEPVNVDAKVPVLVYYHGGGFALKATAITHDLAMRYALGAKCKVVVVNYRTSANHLFPIPVEDCYEGAKWVYEHAETLGIDRERIGLAGDSAGGALAACVAQMLRDRKIFTPKFQVLIYPVIDERLNTQSMQDFDDTPFWNSKLNKRMWRLYLRSTDLTEQLYSAPLMHDDLTNLPKAYIEVAEFDSLRDEGELYADKLRKSDVEVALNKIIGAYHEFDIFQDKEIVKDVMKERIKFLISGFSD